MISNQTARAVFHFSGFSSYLLSPPIDFADYLSPTQKMARKTRQSATTPGDKRQHRPPRTLLEEQSQQHYDSLRKKQEAEEARKKRILAAQKLQQKINEAEKKMKVSMKKAKTKREETMAKKRGTAGTKKATTGKAPTKKGTTTKTKITTKKTKGAATKKASSKASKPAAAAPMFSSFPASFGAPASAVPRSIPCRTDVDLTDYNYGVENSAAPSQLDLVFVLDCTASMGSTIRSCQDSIVSMVNTIIASEGQDVRLCLIPYRDHHMGEQYCTKVYPFTRDTAQMLKNVNEQSAGGGGDGPEAVTAAMFEAVCLEWRENASKIVIFMADAGPHGLEAMGDSYPNGDPDGKDPLAIAREMITLGISVYPILAKGTWCPPTQMCQDFFAAIATVTGGQCLSLADANLLSDCIITGIRENIDLESNLSIIRSQLDSAEKEKGSPLTESEIEAISASVAASGGKKPRSLPEDKLIKVTFEKFSQVTAAATFADLKASWNTGTFTAAPSSAVATESASSRMARMVVARDSRPTDPVLVEIVREGGKLRAKVISPGYDASKNCQFPRDIREEGKTFQVDGIINAGSFYRVKGNIVPL
jgi:hypothetical protein